MGCPYDGPYDGPGRGIIYEPRVVIRYPAPVGATTWGARYALRVSRSVVVALSLSRRNAASESEESKKRLSH